VLTVLRGQARACGGDRAAVFVGRSLPGASALDCGRKIGWGRRGAAEEQILCGNKLSLTRLGIALESRSGLLETFQSIRQNFVYIGRAGRAAGSHDAHSQGGHDG